METDVTKVRHSVEVANLLKEVLEGSRSPFIKNVKIVPLGCACCCVLEFDAYVTGSGQNKEGFWQRYSVADDSFNLE